MEKEFILDQIKRTAAENGGLALGNRRFERATGIRVADWQGQYWARWSDAVREAGCQPNALTAKYSDDATLGKLAVVVRELGYIPTYPELRLRRRTDPSLPDDTVFQRLGGTKQGWIALLARYCGSHPEFQDVIDICGRYQAPAERVSAEVSLTLGDVYLVKSGRYYKIGYSVSAGRRLREFQIQLPDLPSPVHTIRTDDPRGVEAYWHKRFEAKRVRPGAEFFKLDTNDVRAFRAWKRIAP